MLLLISAILYLVAIVDCIHLGQPQGLGNSCTEHSNNQTAVALVEDQLQLPLDKSETSKTKHQKERGSFVLLIIQHMSSSLMFIRQHVR